ncbi:hypothetical protein LTS18_002362, partial [Coniosporium uncinatum]
MQFMFLILALMCVVAAQNVTVSGGAISIVALSPLRTCLNACAEGDVNCKAQCVGVPYPDEAAANRTTACVAACPQGNGTWAETDGYANCQKACFSSYIPGLGSTLVAAGTDAPVSATSSGAPASAIGGYASTSSGSSATPTDSDPS